jgi:hypothetical protein
MKKIICDLPNASTLINGVAFEQTLDGAVMSVDAVSDDVAAQFKGIPGYHLVDAEPKSKQKAEVPTEAPALAPTEAPTDAPTEAPAAVPSKKK